MELFGTFTQTFADIAPDNLDIRGPHCRPRQCPAGPRFWGGTATEVGSKRSPRRKKEHLRDLGSLVRKRLLRSAGAAIMICESMELDWQVCSRARLSRDARFDGKFFIGVLTSRVYCRSICPAPTAKEKNVRYYPSAAAAAEAGFRPCLRCRPECSPGTPG